jgi:hypothetical protein
MKTALKRKKRRVFGQATQTCSKYHGPCKSPQNPKLWAVVYENGHKRKNDEFFVIPVSNIQTVIFLVNVHGTPKQWAIAHENGPKTLKGEFLVMPVKHVLSVMVLVNHPRTPKLWVIANENGPKMQKTMSF